MTLIIQELLISGFSGWSTRGSHPIEGSRYGLIPGARCACEYLMNATTLSRGYTIAIPQIYTPVVVSKATFMAVQARV